MLAEATGSAGYDLKMSDIDKPFNILEKRLITGALAPNILR